MSNMENSSTDVLLGLDIGTSFVRAVIGYINSDGEAEIVDVAKRPANGFLRNATIVNIEEAKKCVQGIIDELEQRNYLEVHSCVTGIGGGQIESVTQRGAVAIAAYGKSERAITEDDVRRVIECANSIKTPHDRKLLHVIPQQYIIDGVDGFKNPVNNLANRLEATVHIVTASITSVQNIKTCVEQANYQLDEIRLKTLAATEAVMGDDERKGGSILIDIGGGSTDVIVIMDDAPIFTCSIPIGGKLVTNDLHAVMDIPLDTAEKLKVENGCCWSPLIENESQEVLVPGFGSRATELTTKNYLCDIISPRMEEIFTMIRDEISREFSANKLSLSGSIILTGGGALLNGAVEMAQYVFRTSSVRLGVPQSLGGIEEKYRSPEFATAIGLFMAHKKLIDSEKKHSRKKESRKTSETKRTGDGVFQRFLKKFF